MERGRIVLFLDIDFLFVCLALDFGSHTSVLRALRSALWQCSGPYTVPGIEPEPNVLVHPLKVAESL